MREGRSPEGPLGLIWATCVRTYKPSHILVTQMGYGVLHGGVGKAAVWR